jgi:hypothetical protein
MRSLAISVSVCQSVFLFHLIPESRNIGVLCVCMCIPVSLLGNNPVAGQRLCKINVVRVVLYAVRVVRKESK